MGDCMHSKGSLTRWCDGTNAIEHRESHVLVSCWVSMHWRLSSTRCVRPVCVAARVHVGTPSSRSSATPVLPCACIHRLLISIQQGVLLDVMRPLNGTPSIVTAAFTHSIGQVFSNDLQCQL